jgi:hypothetical protein
MMLLSFGLELGPAQNQNSSLTTPSGRPKTKTVARVVVALIDALARLGVHGPGHHGTA